MLEISLPWPAKELSPNARIHWAKVADAKKKARTYAAWATKEALSKALCGPTPDCAVELSHTFMPPDYARRDLDNVFNSLKAARDGIADALGVNDRNFTFGAIQWGEKAKDGRILIKITWEAGE